jgi:hypothetical protein
VRGGTLERIGRLARSGPGSALLLFALALAPRVFALGRFLTSDEPLWTERSIAFLKGLLTGQLGQTLQTGHPGVTTMWTGSLGLIMAYLAKGRPGGTLLSFLEGLPADYERMDVTLLPWLRLPTVILAAVCVVFLYLVGRRLVNPLAAALGAILLAFDPLFLAHSRVLHHDALVTIFMTLSVGALCLYLEARRAEEGTDYWRGLLLLFSGGMGGLAFLSKSSAYFLIPFVGLLLATEWFLAWRGKGEGVPRVALIFGGWLLAAGLIFVLLWPAMWVRPYDVVSTLFNWTVQSASGEEVSETVGISWQYRVPDLGVLFYPVNWLLKATLPTFIGIVLLPWWWRSVEGPEGARARRVAAGLGSYALSFAFFMTLGDKQDGRYLLPIYPAVCLLVALGLEWQGRRVLLRSFASPAQGMAALVGLVLLVQALFSLPSYPYYLTYYNPLVGGPWVAPHLVKVGWGEGMEEAARYLNSLDNAGEATVATSYPQNFAPFFKGRFTKHHYDEPADYVLNYIRQVQNGYPYPEYWAYFASRQPIYTLRLGGIDYIWLYRGPLPTRVRNASFQGGLALMGYVLERPVVAPGQEVQVNLIWRVVDERARDYQVKGWLTDAAGEVWGEWPPAPVLAGDGPSPVEGHYLLVVRPETPPGEYRLTVEVSPGQGEPILGRATFGTVTIGQSGPAAFRPAYN